MRLLTTIARLSRTLFRRHEIETDIRDELAAFVDERTERQIKRGVVPAEARRRVLIELEGMRVLGERLVEQRHGRQLAQWIDGLGADLRQGVRRLVRSPTFTTPAILSLSVGMALSTAAVSIVNAFLFRPAPIPDGRALFSLAAVRPNDNLRNFSYLNYVDLRDQNDTFRGLAAYAPIFPRVTATGLSVEASAEAVSGNYFDVFRIRTGVGRSLTLDDDHAGRDPAAVVSDTFWRQDLAGDRDVVGRSLRVNGHLFTIVGVAPAGFRGTDPLFNTVLWIPIAQAADAELLTLTQRTDRSIRTQGFLKAGVTRAEAQSNIDALTALLRQRYPVDNRDLRTLILPERDTRPIIDAARAVVPIAAALLGLALAGLVIDGASLTSLFLARATARQRELAIAAALGATRGRLIRQIVVEGLLLSGFAALVGYVLARWMLDALSTQVLPGSVVIDVRPDGTVAWLALFVASGLGVGTGLLPARVATQPAGQSALQREARFEPLRKPGRLRARVVATQFSVLTVSLMTAATLTTATRVAANADLGFDRAHRLLFTLSPDEFAYDAGRGETLVEAFLARVRVIPGVASASAVYEPPLGAGSSSMSLAPAHANVPPSRVAATVVAPGYFETMATPILRGRSFDDHDQAGSPPVAIINDLLARDFWPGADPIGQHLVAPSDHGDQATFEVVGVAKTGTYENVGELPRPYLWLPYAQQYRSSMTVVAHVSGNEVQVTAAVRQALADIDPAVALSSVTSMTVLASNRGMEAGALLAALAGLVAFLRATFGMYGLLSYTAHLQVRELGIRMALGATPGRIMRLVIGRALSLATRGLAIGLILTLGVIRLFRGGILGVTGPTGLAWIGVPVLLLAVALAAGWLPVERVLAANPIGSLRHE